MTKTVSRKSMFILYALGYLGIAILTQTTVKWYQYYYAPPGSNQYGLETLIPIGFVGLAMIIARIVDGLADPVVAFFSDKSKHPRGRRIPFILYGSVPLTLSFILLWFPPVQGESIYNLIYLTIILSLFFTFFTIVVGPYLALIGELTRTKNERIQVTTMQGITQVIGVMIAEAGSGFLISASGFPVMGIILGLVALSTLILTPLFVRESLDNRGSSEEVSFFDSIKMTFENFDFLVYLVSYLAIWYGINTLTISMPYITEILLRKSADTSGYMIAGAFILALLFSPLIPKIMVAFSKKQIMIISSIFFAIILAATGLFGTLIPYGLASVVVILAGIPIAVIFVVPNAMVADIAEYDGLRHKQYREGMFFGVQGLVMKIVIGLSSFVTPLIFDTFGYSVENPLGLQLSGPIAGLAVLLGVLILTKYSLTEEMLEQRVQEAGPVQN